MHPYLEKIIPKEEREAAEMRIPRTADQMENVVKTSFPVTDMNLFRVFLDANDMSHFEIGYYTNYEEHSFSHIASYGMNNLCYSTTGQTFLTESNIMYMNIKFGSLEKAFKDFKEECYKRT
jgi:hypothetical protein